MNPPKRRTTVLALTFVTTLALLALPAPPGSGGGSGTAEAAPRREIAGARAFAARGCGGCHATDGSKLAGPSLRGVFGRSEATNRGTVQADESYVRESIVSPSAKIVRGYDDMMPSYQGTLSDAELGDLVAYLRSLR